MFLRCARPGARVGQWGGYLSAGSRHSGYCPTVIHKMTCGWGRGGGELWGEGAGPLLSSPVNTQALFPPGSSDQSGANSAHSLTSCISLSISLGHYFASSCISKGFGGSGAFSEEFLISLWMGAAAGLGLPSVEGWLRFPLAPITLLVFGPEAWCKGKSLLAFRPGF